MEILDGDFPSCYYQKERIAYMYQSVPTGQVLPAKSRQGQDIIRIGKRLGGWSVGESKLHWTNVHIPVKQSELAETKKVRRKCMPLVVASLHIPTHMHAKDGVVVRCYNVL